MKLFQGVMLLLLSQLSVAAEDKIYQIQCDANATTASQCQVDSATTQGWNTFHGFCKKCHAEDALGSDDAPNLVDSLAQMSKEDFLANLLTRLPKHHKWQQKPQVIEQQEQLWIYLRARADQALPPGRLNVPEPVPYKIVCNTETKSTNSNPCQVDKGTFEGWRVFHGFCQGCHGRDANGNTVAPHLLESLKTMSKQSFTEKLLNDYQVYHPWIKEHEVAKHVDDLWAYLTARLNGVLPINRPNKLQ